MSRVVSSARAWIGTPYVHQASTRGAGADCLGLLRGVWRDLLGAEPLPVPPYTPDWDEVARREVLWTAARRVLIPVDGDPLAPGQVLLFRMRGGSVAKHLGIVSALGAASSFVHAYTGVGVVETPLTVPWTRRIVARFAFPETATEA